MTSFTFCPEVVGQTHLDDAVAVAVLEQSAALDAVDIARAVDFVGWREAHYPFCHEVQPLSELVLDASADGHIDCCTAVVAAVETGSQAEGDKRRQPSCSPVFLSGAVGPEVVLETHICLCEAVVELVVLRRIPGADVVARTFHLACPEVQGHCHTGVQTVFGEERRPGLHPFDETAVEVAQISHQPEASAQLHPVFRFFLGVCGYRGCHHHDRCQQFPHAYSMMSPRHTS